MKTKPILFYLFATLLLVSCAEGENNAYELGDGLEMAPEPQAQEVTVERKLIKEGAVSFETKDMEATRAVIFESIKKHKGYVSSDQEYNSDLRITNTIVIRVPAEQFDILLTDATKGVGKFDAKNIQIKDVTEEFLDVSARLKTKKELENRYLELSKDAKNVTEMLAVEAQVGQLRTEIESIEGRLKYLESQVSMSTLTIDFYQTIPDQTQFGNKFKNGFKNGWDNLVWFFVGLVNVWPFVILIPGVVFWFIIRRRKKRKLK